MEPETSFLFLRVETGHNVLRPAKVKLSGPDIDKNSLKRINQKRARG